MTGTQNSKKLLFFLTHPAHFHLFKNAIRRLKARFGGGTGVIKNKEGGTVYDK